MVKRIAPAVAALVVLAAYAGLYVLGWWNVQRVSVNDRDGMEWFLMAVLTPPWCLLAPTFGFAAVHAGAVVNGSLFAGVAAWNVRSWVRRTAG